MINFEDLIEGLMDKKEGVESIEEAPEKEKIMNHLKMAKQMADDSGMDFMSLAKECGGMKTLATEQGEEEEYAENESEDEEEKMSPEGQTAKQKAIIMMLKSKKA